MTFCPDARHLRSSERDRPDVCPGVRDRSPDAAQLRIAAAGTVPGTEHSQRRLRTERGKIEIGMRKTVHRAPMSGTVFDSAAEMEQF